MDFFINMSLLGLLGLPYIIWIWKFLYAVYLFLVSKIWSKLRNPIYMAIPFRRYLKGLNNSIDFITFNDADGCFIEYRTVFFFVSAHAGCLVLHEKASTKI